MGYYYRFFGHSKENREYYIKPYAHHFNNLKEQSNSSKTLSKLK